jgi:hypothetical protein
MPETILDRIAKTGFSVPRQTIDLRLTGMTCAACAERIEKRLNGLPGVEARVNPASELARELSAGPHRPRRLARRRRPGRLWRLPAERRQPRPGKGPQGGRLSARTPRIRCRRAIHLALAGEMLFMFGGGHGLLPGWLQWLLATPVQFVAGKRFYSGAWHALRGGGANMDVLVALGTSAAYFYSLATYAARQQRPISTSRPAPPCHPGAPGQAAGKSRQGQDLVGHRAAPCLEPEDRAHRTRRARCWKSPSSRSSRATRWSSRRASASRWMAR